MSVRVERSDRIVTVILSGPEVRSAARTLCFSCPKSVRVRIDLTGRLLNGRRLYQRTNPNRSPCGTSHP
jgi:hypothetical protein